MSSSKTTLAFLIYGLLVQCNVLSYPNIRYGNLPSFMSCYRTAGFDEEGNSLTDLTFDTDQISIRSSPSVTEDAYTFYSPPSKRMERHADGMFNKAYRKALGQLSARKYLHTLMAKRVGGASMIEDDNEPLSKRHSDGVFTDSYSHYRKQMAVKKYLAAVLGKRYRQRYRSKGRRLAYL
uniref:Glucagon family neuropeptides-like n=1 Tax=Sinocyclocheilus anshuiensis TaxID=1608454 RepID=A0A671QXD8_9TELE